jgi:hypothetical protein
MREGGIKENSEILCCKCDPSGKIQPWFIQELKQRGWGEWIEWIREREPFR